MKNPIILLIIIALIFLCRRPKKSGKVNVPYTIYGPMKDPAGKDMLVVRIANNDYSLVVNSNGSGESVEVQNYLFAVYKTDDNQFINLSITDTTTGEVVDEIPFPL